jgi:hypothetical protein
MAVERDIVIERDEDGQSATDRASAYTTFIGAASSMPRFTDEELNKGRDKITQALEEIGAESGDPLAEGNDAPPAADDDL